jgi:hypothetical protein
MFKSRGFFLCVLLCLALGSVAQAQTVTLSGTVTDNQGGVLPGVTITVTDVDTGRQQVSVTDANGVYRFPILPAGTYRLEADLSGFAHMVLPSLELLVGQAASVPIKMSLAGVEETVTVTGESPLVDVLTSEVAGNVDRRMMEDLPVQGRNWMELSLLVKGVTGNDTANNRPGTIRDESFQLNLDGQQITQRVASSFFGQPKFSREAIAEFEIVTNQFDITQGRSAGMQVNAITRSGTNNLSGAFYGYFRDDALNAADHVAGEVLPFQNQQIGGAIGGPIIQDKLHYFVSYEYERQPSTTFAQPPLLPGQSFTIPTPVTQNSVMGRVDHSVTDSDQLSYRVSYWDFQTPDYLTSNDHPTNSAERTQNSLNILGTWTKLWNADMVSELKIGYNGFEWQNLLAHAGTITTKPGAAGSCSQEFGSTTDQLACQPNYVFPGGLTIGGPRNYPQRFTQDLFSGRFQLNWSKGSHDMKIGGEFLKWRDGDEWHLLERGEFIFDERPTDLNRRFPQECSLDPSCWDLSGLDSTVNRFNQNVGNWTIDIPRPSWAIWFGDTWQANDNLTVNYGVRWDVDWGALAPPFVTTQITFNQATSGREAGSPLFKSDIRDLNNVAPRFGFAYDVGGRGDLVIRGGTGLFYTVSSSNVTFSQQSFNTERILVNSFPNDGQPGFIEDPTRGVTPDDILNGRVDLPPQAPRVIAHDYVMPYSWQSSVGFQKQIGADLGVDADFVYWKSYNDPYAMDPNLFFDSATGYNLPISQFGRPDPKFTQVRYLTSKGNQDYAALQTGVRRRFKDNYQIGLTYTLMFMRHDDTTSWGYFPNNSFNPKDDWATAVDFQRHTLRLNGMYQFGYGFQVSAAYYYGSGNRFATELSGNPTGKPASDNRLNLTGNPIPIPQDVQGRFDGPDVIGEGPGNEAPRNALEGYGLHRIDVRVTKVFDLGAIRISGIAEIFNLFDNANYGSYNGVINSSTFGDPRQNGAIAYGPRSAQLAFRIDF